MRKKTAPAKISRINTAKPPISTKLFFLPVADSWGSGAVTSGLGLVETVFLAGAFLTGAAFFSGFCLAGAVFLAGLTAGFKPAVWGATESGAASGVGGLATKKGFLHFLQLT